MKNKNVILIRDRMIALMWLILFPFTFVFGLSLWLLTEHSFYDVFTFTNLFGRFWSDDYDYYAQYLTCIDDDEKIFKTYKEYKNSLKR